MDQDKSQKNAQNDIVQAVFYYFSLYYKLVYIICVYLAKV